MRPGVEYGIPAVTINSLVTLLPNISNFPLTRDDVLAEPSPSVKGIFESGPFH
jgi:hypothetical protein